MAPREERKWQFSKGYRKSIVPKKNDFGTVTSASSLVPLTLLCGNKFGLRGIRIEAFVYYPLRLLLAVPLCGC